MEPVSRRPRQPLAEIVEVLSPWLHVLDALGSLRFASRGRNAPIYIREQASTRLSARSILMRKVLKTSSQAQTQNEPSWCSLRLSCLQRVLLGALYPCRSCSLCFLLLPTLCPLSLSCLQIVSLGVLYSNPVCSVCTLVLTLSCQLGAPYPYPICRVWNLVLLTLFLSAAGASWCSLPQSCLQQLSLGALTLSCLQRVLPGALHPLSCLQRVLLVRHSHTPKFRSPKP